MKSADGKRTFMHYVCAQQQSTTPGRTGNNVLVSDLEAVMKWLIKNRADVNVASAKGGTPLHYAACSGLTSIISILLDHNAKIEVQS